MKEKLSDKSAMEDMIDECGCRNCRQKRMCNGTDLMNCYAKKRLTIKKSPTKRHYNIKGCIAKKKK